MTDNYNAILDDIEMWLLVQFRSNWLSQLQTWIIVLEILII